MKQAVDEVYNRVFSAFGMNAKQYDIQGKLKDQLDAPILKLAGKELAAQELSVFLMLFACAKKWDDIMNSYHDVNGKIVDDAAVRRAARRAIVKLVDRSLQDRSIKILMARLRS